MQSLQISLGLSNIHIIRSIPVFTPTLIWDDGKDCMYDMNEDICTLEGYSALKEIPGLFDLVQLDESRTCVFWNDYIDLPSDIIYEYAK